MVASVMLESCLDALIDYRGKTPRKVNKGIPLITAKVVKAGQINPPDEFISEEEYEAWMTRGYPQMGDIVLTTEAPLGEVAQIKFLPVALAQRIVTLRGKKNILDNGYLLYLLQSEEMKAKLIGRSTGTTVVGIKQSELRKIEITLPPITEQRAIAHILGTLDDKIELHRQMNETLEAMARTLFKSWFVDFDPVRAKMDGRWKREQSLPGLPAHLFDLFPSELEDSELGEIPKGWRAGQLRDVCTVIGGFAFKSKDFSIAGHPVVKIKNISQSLEVDLQDVDYVSTEVASKVPKFHLEDGSLVMAMTGATVGKYGIVINTSDHAPVLNQRVALLVPKGEGTGFLLSALLSTDLYDQVVLCAQGSAQPNISADGIMDARLITPSNKIQLVFNKISNIFFDRWMVNKKESLQLANIRNSLLPKLISGEICVKDAEKMRESHL